MVNERTFRIMIITYAKNIIVKVGVENAYASGNRRHREDVVHIEREYTGTFQIFSRFIGNSR
ncbi:hypothetical protein SDC9_205338 [bioreactor metagenome]|uniref:Uncharacterized protein n=1 Tax=bioreactor metagenome TaxID=1076179 RepID=A0A645JB17_9ZZZZ